MTSSYEPRYPHCDSSVLHAPGECRYCDNYPQAQQERIDQKLNFTGQNKPGFGTCPSEVRRSLKIINAWPGNRPYPEECSCCYGQVVTNEHSDDCDRAKCDTCPVHVVGAQ